MVQATVSNLGKTETAPNSSTGSGRLVFPRADGVVSSFLPGELGNVASQKPLRATGRPSKTASSILERGHAVAGSVPEESRPRRNSSVGSRSASAQFVIGSARGQPRLDPVKENLRSPARRPIQA